ncbi:hypothetical protein [Occallatibacter savannae]|uniref:hypothetical protein n=1 Tax=Occallatibacter savannae TaxID=1002691 RepID=UPI0013A56C25|nr:hypothetical protein [Occallatibacter savannae]
MKTATYQCMTGHIASQTYRLSEPLQVLPKIFNDRGGYKTNACGTADTLLSEGAKGSRIWACGHGLAEYRFRII